MQIQEAVSRILELLEQKDEEEYTSVIAESHIGQAIRELSEENEFKFMNELSSFTLTTPAEGLEPAYWVTVPGRANIMSVLGTTWEQFGYIKRAWLGSDDGQQPFEERDLRELLDEYGDSTGDPEKYAIEGDYIYWRPIPEAGDDHVARFFWHRLPTVALLGSTSRLLDVAPFAVIYKACEIASIWMNEDQRILTFDKLAERALEKFNARHSMTNDGPREMEQYDG